MAPGDSFHPQTAFEGYIKGKLESIEQRLNALPCNDTFKRLNKCETDIANIKGRATLWGAIFGFIAGIFSKIILGK